MKIYVFRVILNTEEDIFRDIEIATESDFEAFHNAIKQAFDFQGEEMASFYMSDDDWTRGEEIPLLDMREELDDEARTMANSTLSSFITSPSEKLLYVYDFLRMWIFYIELVAVKKGLPSTIYPKVAMVYGDAPAENSREIDLMAGIEGEPGDYEDGEDYLTGDPELDEYLRGDDDEEGSLGNIDDLDDTYY
jgi:hypothetical protein